MSAEGRELQSLFEAEVRLGKEVEEAKPGDPELAVVVQTVNELQQRLQGLRGVMSPIMDDASRAPSFDEEAAAQLERALASLLSAAKAKQVVG